MRPSGSGCASGGCRHADGRAVLVCLHPTASRPARSARGGRRPRLRRSTPAGCARRASGRRTTAQRHARSSTRAARGPVMRPAWHAPLRPRRDGGWSPVPWRPAARRPARCRRGSGRGLRAGRGSGTSSSSCSSSRSIASISSRRRSTSSSSSVVRACARQAGLELRLRLGADLGGQRLPACDLAVRTVIGRGAPVDHG